MKRDASTRLKAMLIVNPYSSGITHKREQAIVRTLRDYLDLEVRRTERSGHAPELAREAIDAGAELLIACGGDGTANEVVNGLAVDTDSADSLPLFAVIPAGGTNVLCRGLGMVNDPVRATIQLATAIAARRATSVTLGRVDERAFLFSAGVGLDGAIIKRIEQKRSGRRPSDLSHMSTVVGLFMRERFALEERMTLTIDDTGEQMRAALVMCGNAAPLSYMGKLKLNFMPDNQLEGGLDLMAPRHVSALFAIRNVLGASGLLPRVGQLHPEAKRIVHDVDSFTVECDSPQPVQVDGEFIGDRTHLHFHALRNALRLVY